MRRTRVQSGAERALTAPGGWRDRLGAMAEHSVAVIAGDGIGPEVIAQGVRVLRALADRRGLDIAVREYDLGAERYLKDGTSFPDEIAHEIEERTGRAPGGYGAARQALVCGPRVISLQKRGILAGPIVSLIGVGSADASRARRLLRRNKSPASASATRLNFPLQPGPWHNDRQDGCAGAEIARAASQPQSPS